MKLSTTILSLSLLSTSIFASTQKANFDTDLLNVQQHWAVANYEKNEEQKEQEFKALINQATSLTETYPDRAESWVWHGIVQSSYASVEGGLSALSFVDNAKEAFEIALSIDESALEGSAHTSLGILYLKVPGWPISFGDDDDAKRHLNAALNFNPKGIDVNYFLAEYYVDQKKYLKAKEHLLLAQLAPKRSQRPLADKYRHEEINELLTRVNRKIAK